MYRFLLAFCGALLFLTASSVAWTAEITYLSAHLTTGRLVFTNTKQVMELFIKYFILKSSDGVIRAAFDACDVCWGEGKGYQKDDCGDLQVRETFLSTKVNVVTGR